MTLQVENADDWYERVKAKGLSITRDIQNQPWNSCDFILLDPSGNTIVITSDLA